MLLVDVMLIRITKTLLRYKQFTHSKQKTNTKNIYLQNVILFRMSEKWSTGNLESSELMVALCCNARQR